MIGWKVRNIISIEANVDLKIYKKTLISFYIEHCITAWSPMMKDGN